MLPFRVLEHTADVGFEAFGRTKEEVFANAGRALFSLMVDLDSIWARDDLRIEASVSGSDADTSGLLVNWLSEILYLYDAEGWLLRDFEVRSLNSRSISAVARGERFDRARHQIKLLVKAITYHQLALEEAASGWRAQVYVDI
jgi:protein archease